MRTGASSASRAPVLSRGGRDWTMETWWGTPLWVNLNLLPQGRSQSPKPAGGAGARQQALPGMWHVWQNEVFPHMTLVAWFMVELRF